MKILKHPNSSLTLLSQMTLHLVNPYPQLSASIISYKWRSGGVDGGRYYTRIMTHTEAERLYASSFAKYIRQYNNPDGTKRHWGCCFPSNADDTDDMTYASATPNSQCVWRANPTGSSYTCLSPPLFFLVRKMGFIELVISALHRKKWN